MMPEIRITEVFSNMNALGKAMRALTEQDVFVGVPEDKTAREEAEDTGISNAYLAYIHEYGVPENNLPARPALNPGIQDIVPDAVAILENAAKQAMEGKAEAVERCLTRIGLLALRSVKKRFTENSWAPLNEKTLNRRPKLSESMNKKGQKVVKYGKSRLERGRINPLVDTNQLRKAYTYVIRARQNKAQVVQ